jgi:hypothetical protein
MGVHPVDQSLQYPPRDAPWVQALLPVFHDVVQRSTEKQNLAFDLIKQTASETNKDYEKKRA